MVSSCISPLSKYRFAFPPIIEQICLNIFDTSVAAIVGVCAFLPISLRVCISFFRHFVVIFYRFHCLSNRFPFGKLLEMTEQSEKRDDTVIFNAK